MLKSVVCFFITDLWNYLRKSGSDRLIIDKFKNDNPSSHGEDTIRVYWMMTLMYSEVSEIENIFVLPKHIIKLFYDFIRGLDEQYGVVVSNWNTFKLLTKSVRSIFGCLLVRSVTVQIIFTCLMGVLFILIFYTVVGFFASISA